MVGFAEADGLDARWSSRVLEVPNETPERAITSTEFSPPESFEGVDCDESVVRSRFCKSTSRAR
jgi:hypothetical protein